MSRRLPIDIESRARDEIEVASAWWRKNRPKSPELLLDELEQAYELIRRQPFAGQTAKSKRLESVRRVLLGRSRYYLYYRVTPDQRTVVVLSLWHTGRGKEPEVG